MKKGVILVDDHAAFRNALRQHLHEDSEFHVIGEFADGPSVLAAKMDPQCALVLLDISMPKVDGLKVLERISERYPEIQTLIVSGRDDAVYRRAAKEKGAAGFVSKDSVYRDLIPAIRKVLAGEDYFPESG